MTKISYLEPTLAFEAFSSIESEVKTEWKKNHILKGLLFFWGHNFRNTLFSSLAEVK